MKRIISLVITAALVLPMFAIPANAATWVTVSSWAYNSVSNFKKEGLLPESFEHVDDYTQNITRLQFAELLYAVLLKTKCVYGNSAKYEFDDTDSFAARQLGDCGVMNGEDAGVEQRKTGTGSQYIIHHKFYPGRPLTREEMASVIYRTAKLFSPHLVTEEADDSDYTLPTDNYEIAEWARENVYRLERAGIIAGMEDGSFAPKSSLTIEQAIQALYSLYNEIPSSLNSDGANIRTDGEAVVKTYANGLKETKIGDVLYLKNGDTVLMEFETDIYSNIYSATVNGTIYAAAQNVFGKTDIYNAETKELLIKIPRLTYDLTKDCIITKSSNAGPMTFGVYDYSGNELLSPEYSLSEIEAIQQNGWIIPSEEKREASGWIYYIDADDNYSLYKIDSNGENKQKISNRRCYNLEYINGRIYFSVQSDSEPTRIYSVKPDGSDERSFQPPSWYDGFLENRYIECMVDSSDLTGHQSYWKWNDSEYPGGERVYSRTAFKSRFFHDDAVYMEAFDGEEVTYSIWRAVLSEDGFEIENILEGYDVNKYQVKDGKIYFIDQTESKAREGIVWGLPGILYCYDNGKIIKLYDKEIYLEGFYKDNIVFYSTENSDHYYYIMNADGTNVRVMEDIENALKEYEAAEPHSVSISTDIYEDLSDEKFTVYTEQEMNEWGAWSIYCRDSKGQTSLISESGEIYKNGIYYAGRIPEKRIGDTIYYLTEADTQDKQSTQLTAYDMNTGESRLIASNVSDIKYGENADGKNWLTYTDYSYNIWRVNGADELSEVFPCKGIRKYGALQAIVKLDGSYYKVDTDGNYSLLTGGEKYYNYVVYVQNGASEGIHFH